MSQNNSRASSESRREIILQAAAELFFEQGYAATSIDAIIERVGGSKRNIYSEFGNKEGLFNALVSGCTEKMTLALTLPETLGKDLRDTLMLLAYRMLHFYMSPMMLGIYRTTLMEAHRFPEWSQTFYDNGPKQAIDLFARVLGDAADRGELRGIDCQLAAGHFIGMLKDNQYYQVVLGLRPPLTEAESRRQVQSIVDIFLHGVLVDKS
ncbi:TetR/AcrR family transcriptional regulator [Shewanella sedimentimangrovi]|uniref:TetR/AcrR family transcriptional regulator n=1 Tax=Shewanella sedimentimangrovi TaxID=2814293 RepID=A0ABX7QZS4_9GAMM|nr:TetR/AcrR family transcriptional regulator [Shewanella sedimentimangrovi]QSX37021.1 TetR/AcrR family transcriptional regulator [Shewanella sedimentimangrovi]